MFKTDKTAILMATYNGEKYLKDQIISIQEQSVEDWELFIHDDGSSDGTVDIIREFIEARPEKIHIVEGPSQGSARDNFFFLMKNVDAPYIMLCDQDDIWLPDKIEKSYKKITELEKEKGAAKPVLCFSDLTIVNADLKVIAPLMSVYRHLDPTRIAFKDLLIQNVITGCTIIMNRTCAQRSTVNFNKNLVIKHDWWCALVASCFGYIGYIEEPLILYRQHENNSHGVKAVSSPGNASKKTTRSREIRDSLRKTRLQAKEFVLAYGFGKADLADEYASLGNFSKIKRLRFYSRNKMWKSGLFRNIGLLIWG